MSQTITIHFDETILIGGLPVRLNHVEISFAELIVGEPDQARTFRKKFKRPVDCTPADEQAVLELAKVWCRTVTRITVLNQARASAIFARLRDGYRFDACRSAIEEYGRDDWHRKKNAWLDITDFFRPEKLEIWIRKAEDRKDAAEKQRHANERIENANVQQTVNQVAEARRLKSEEEQLTAIWTAKSQQDQDALYEQAFDELEALHPGIRPRLKKSWKHWKVQQQILTILRRENTHGAHVGT